MLRILARWSRCGVADWHCDRYAWRTIRVVPVAAQPQREWKRTVTDQVTDQVTNKVITLTDLIKSRRSIGEFTDQPVPDGLVEELLEVAVWTPNHHLTEPWRFVYIVGEGRHKHAAIRRDMAMEFSKSTNEEDKRKAGEGAYTKFMNIPAYLVVAMREDPDPEVREEDFAACSCLIQNFMLLAWERGLGTSWKTFKNDPRMRALLSLEPNEKVVGVLHLGYPAEVGSSQRKPARNRITYIR
jgi:nitroreductase